jgi:hypothetical protein
MVSKVGSQTSLVDNTALARSQIVNPFVFRFESSLVSAVSADWDARVPPSHVRWAGELPTTDFSGAWGGKRIVSVCAVIQELCRQIAARVYSSGSFSSSSLASLCTSVVLLND